MNENETHAALDRMHEQAITEALDELAALEQKATPRPWHGGGNIYGTGEHCFPLAKVYRPEDRNFICALRNVAARLINQCRNIVDIVARLDEVHVALNLPLEADAAAKVRELTKALEFYASPQSYAGYIAGREWSSAIENDKGEKARAALKK